MRGSEGKGWVQGRGDRLVGFGDEERMGKGGREINWSDLGMGERFLI